MPIPRSHDQVADVLEWSCALLKLVHPSYGMSASAVQQLDATLQEELVFVWNHLRDALRRYVEAAHASVLGPGVSLPSATESVDRCLGYANDGSSEPCLWRHGGHPFLSSDEKIAADHRSVLELAGLTRYEPFLRTCEVGWAHHRTHCTRHATLTSFRDRHVNGTHTL